LLKVLLEAGEVGGGKESRRGHQWVMSVIIATQEAEIRIAV
jgi:hypothetical protein